MRTRPIQSSSYPVSSTHRSVLLHEALEQLDIQPDDTVVDATLGGAGHARAIAERLGEKGVLVGFDLDADAIQRARDALTGVKPETHFVQANFRDLASELPKLGLPGQGITHITKALFDLGWSSYQLDSGRGFSFRGDEPLIMTYSNPPAGGASSLTAATIVNEWAEESIADVIFGWGEERYARRIAKAISAARNKKPIRTSVELAEIIKSAVPTSYRHGRLHPATRTFQALRIAVNDELGALKQGLAAAWEMLKPGGRIAVVTFHSIEDRVVKQLFREWEVLGEGKRTSKKPIVPSRAEVAENPRSRSAKLRVISKTK